MEEILYQIRSEIENIGIQLEGYDGLMTHEEFDKEEDFPGQHTEMRANIMLAYRHLEDARMRIGKVLQQIQGGISIYDPPKKEDPPKKGKPVITRPKGKKGGEVKAE